MSSPPQSSHNSENLDVTTSNSSSERQSRELEENIKNQNWKSTTPEKSKLEANVKLAAQREEEDNNVRTIIIIIFFSRSLTR